MKFKFPKGLRLLTRRDYKRMTWRISRREGEFLIIDVKDNQLDKTRLGITVTRRFGDAHVRNRFKRIVREAFRITYTELPKGLDLNVRPRSRALNAALIDVQADLRQLCQ